MAHFGITFKFPHTALEDAYRMSHPELSAYTVLSSQIASPS